MNRIYRKVWNKALGQVVVASELASSCVSVGGDARRTGRVSLAPLAIALGVLIGGSGLSDVHAQSIAIGDTMSCASSDLPTREGLCAMDGNAEATGIAAVALGASAVASAENSVALGSGAVADRDNTVSVGAVGAERQITNIAAGTEDTDAVNKAQLDAVSAASSDAQHYFAANGAADGSDDAQASGAGSVAAGVAAVASGVESTAVGNNSVAAGDYSSALGYVNTANGVNSTAVGNFNQVDGDNSNAFGFANLVNAGNALVVGSNSMALAANSVAVGESASALAENSVALGSGSRASEADVVSVGGGNGSDGPATRRIVNVGAGRVAEDSTDAINGSQLHTTNERVGVVETRVDDIDSRIGDVEGVAANAVTYDDSSRQLLRLAGADGTTVDNMAAGSVAMGSMQAVNGGQLYASLNSMASLLGGGAALGMQGMFVAPTYVVQGASFNTVGDALRALDGQVSAINTYMAGHGDGKGGDPTGGKGGGVVLGDRAAAPDVTGTGIGHDARAFGVNDTAVGGNAQVNAEGSTAVGANSRILEGAENAVAIGESASASATAGTAVGQGASVTAKGAVALGQGAVADRADTVSVGSAGNERQIVNVAAGTRATDAVNKAQLDSGMAAANAYTDSRFTGLSDSFDVLRGDMDARLRQVNRRMDRQGAMGAAMLNMATSAAGVRTPNRVGVGVGFQGGESALSLGYQRALSDRATLTFGGAFSSDDSSVGIGAGFGW